MMKVYLQHRRVYKKDVMLQQCVVVIVLIIKRALHKNKQTKCYADLVEFDPLLSFVDNSKGLHTAASMESNTGSGGGGHRFSVDFVYSTLTHSIPVVLTLFVLQK
jgi:hypothetical protein